MWTPVLPSTTVSISPPTAEATTGTPQAIASRGTIPNGSYHGTQATTSAERMSAGRASRPTRPRKSTRSSTPCRSASARRRRISRSRPSPVRSGPPATTSSASGTSARALMRLPTPLRATSRPTNNTRYKPGCLASAAPSGRNRVRSTPHGRTDTRRRSAPIRTSSNSSSEQVATIRSSSRTRCSSIAIRCAGEVSLWPWCRRLTTPSAWKVCTTGIPSGRAAASAARPDIQKWAWTTSGRSRSHSVCRSRAKSSMYGSSSSLGTAVGGPAATWSTTTPGCVTTRRRRAWSSRRVCTVTSTPRPARAADSEATWTFCPPASTPPSTASGLACSDTMATLMHLPPRRPSVGRERLDGGDDVRGGDRIETRVPGDGAGAGTRRGAGRLLVAEQHGGDAPRPPPFGRDDRREQRDHRGAHGGGQVRGPGVADHHGGGAVEHVPQLGEREPSAEVGPAPGGDLRGQRRLARGAGDHDAPPVVDQRGGELRHPAGGRDPCRDRRPRVDDDVRVGAGEGAGVRERPADREPAVVTGRQRQARRGGEGQHPLDLVQARLRWPVPQVEQ